MSILYLLTAPAPPFDGTDAVLREVSDLRHAFHGAIVNLSPSGTPTRRFPKQLYGFHKIKEIRKLETQNRINHLFFSFPYFFPILRLLRNPIYYTVTASLDVRKRPPAYAQLQRLQRIIVSNDRDAAVLNSWGLTNYAVIPPGVDTTGITPAVLPMTRELTLLMASAPWHRTQFDSKGIDLLLAACAKLPYLRLILLWRGVLTDELAKRVKRLDIGHRVEIVDRKVNVNDYFSRAHATVLLAKRGGLIKSFPHSLVESLVAGKPVLLSDTIAMADYVNNHQCGIVVSDANIRSLNVAIDTLMRNYVELARNAARIDGDQFSVGALVENHRRLYGL
jgi:glycosyltransferase involved in cell wall biosynthesis